MSSMPRSLDRINPVFVKEIRQAVRGRTFRSSFILALVIAAVVSTAVLSNINVDDPSALAQSGANCFFALHLVYLFCTLVVVPVQAHRAMASERDERTFDALLISGLSPAQIILGKWLGAGTTMAIFLVAMLPFFATAATLYGLDLLVALMLTLLASAVGMTLSLVGILAACLGKTKAMGSMLMMVFLGGCGFAMMGLGGFASQATFIDMGFGSTGEFLTAMMLLVASSGFALFWLHGVAVATISHPEENGMLRVRWASLSIAIFMGIAPLVLATIMPFSPGRALFPLLSSGVAFLAFFNMPTLTESTEMRVRCRYEVESGRWRRFGSWLFMPGGGSGFVLFLLQLLIAGLPTLWYLLDSRVPGVAFGDHLQVLFDEGLGGYLTTLGACVACVAVPAFIAARPQAKPWLRNSMRFFMVTSPLWIVFFLGMLTLLLQVRGGDLFETPLNPIWAIDRNMGDLDEPGAMAFWLMVAALASLPMLMMAAGQRRALRKIRQGAEESS